jgi:hypothetical protein
MQAEKGPAVVADESDVERRSTPWPFKYSVGPQGGLVINSGPPQDAQQVKAARDVEYESVREALDARGIRSTSPKKTSRRHPY